MGRPGIVLIAAFEHYAPDAFAVEAANRSLKLLRAALGCGGLSAEQAGTVRRGGGA